MILVVEVVLFLVEAAFQVESSGKVLAIDYDENAVELTKKNMQKNSKFNKYHNCNLW